MVLFMQHLPQFVQDLGVILITAAVVTLIFKRLKQPVVLGYIMAGLLVGPHFPFVPNVTDTAGIKVWAEIGIIFLLFGVGLEFSFKKLKEIGVTALCIASFKILFMLLLGFIAGKILKWSFSASLFLGAILSISSTTIIISALKEISFKQKRYLSLIVGILIVEDVIAILMLALLPMLVTVKTVSGWDILAPIFSLSVFLLFYLLIGIFVLPVFIKKIHPLMNDETRLILCLGLCFIMAILSNRLGLSSVLGAFVMGSLLAETVEGKQMEQLIIPVRDLFAAVFFVSVGMLIDPQAIYEHYLQIILLSILTLVGKFIATTIGALLSGEKIKNSVQAGMGLAQIGEFSFIMVTLAISLGIVEEFLYPVTVAISCITTFTTPYMLRSSESFSCWVEQKFGARRGT